MLEFLSTPAARATLYVAIALILLAILYYIAQLLRQRMSETPPSASDLMSSFRELHQHGNVTETEFRKIKTILGQRLQDEVRDSDNEG